MPVSFANGVYIVGFVELALSLTLALLIGFVASLPARLPPLRWAAQDRRGVRFGLLAAVGLLAFAAGFTYHTWITSCYEWEVMVMRSSSDRLPPNWADNQAAVKAELWRQAAAGPLFGNCFSPDPFICSVAGLVRHDAASDPELQGGFWLQSLVFGLAAALIAVGLSWRLTRGQR